MIRKDTHNEIFDQVISGPRLEFGSLKTHKAMTQQLHYIFLTVHLPTELLDSSFQHYDSQQNWLMSLKDYSVDSEALQKSLGAFFAGGVARKRRDDRLLNKAREMYMQGLEQLQVALKHPVQRLADETLAACMALANYELASQHPDGPNLFMVHQAGAAKLIRLRGPEAHMSGFGRSLFLSMRMHLVSS